MTKRVKLRSIADCTTDLTAGELSAVFSAIERADAIQCDRLLYCEVGVFKGGTFVQAMRKIDRLEYARPEKRWDVVGIDLFEDWHEDWPTNTHISGQVYRDDLDNALEKAGFGGYWLFKGQSDALLKTLVADRDICGVVFIDANHTYDACKQDCLAALDVIKRGYLVLHNASEQEAKDYPHCNGGPWRAAQELIAERKDLTLYSIVERCLTLEKV